MLGIEWDGRRWPIKGAAERSGRRRCCFGKFTSPYPSLPTCVTHFFQYDSWNPIGKTCAIDSASISSWEKRIVASFNYHIFWPINITVTGISRTLEKLILTPSIPPPPLFLIVFFWVSSMFELFRECAAALNGCFISVRLMNATVTYLRHRGASIDVVFTFLGHTVMEHRVGGGKGLPVRVDYSWEKKKRKKKKKISDCESKKTKGESHRWREEKQQRESTKQGHLI